MIFLAESVGGKNRVTGGPFGSKLTQADYLPVGVPVIRGSNMEHCGRWIGGDFAFVSAEKVECDLKSNLAHVGDIVVTQRGTLGQVSIIPEDAPFDRFVVSQSQMAISVDRNRADPFFVYYFLRSPLFNEYLGNATIQTGVPHINLAILRNAPTEWPDLKLQTAISNTLGSLDDKIELNRRMNETLERLAQAIFRDWFVDFGPVRRKLEGATDPVKIMGGVFAGEVGTGSPSANTTNKKPVTTDPDEAARLAALFPATLADDGLPEGWGWSTVGDQFDLKIGRTPPRKEQAHFTDGEHGVPWISIRDLGECGVFAFMTSEGLTEEAAAAFRVPLIKAGTVIVSFKLTVGRVAIAARDMLSNEAIAQLGNKLGGPSPLFAYCWMKQFDYSQLASTSSIATAVNSKSIAAMRFPIAGDRILESFHRVASPVFEMIESRTHENRTLAAMRDLLLPKLMSGEIRLKDAEKIVEAAE